METDSHLFVRYFLGQCSESEKEEIRRWMEADEAHKKQFIRERIRFDASLIIGDERIPAIQTRNRAGNLLRAIAGIAAAILVLAGSSFLFTLYRTGKDGKGGRMQEIHVPTGSWALVRLADGSDVWLNSNTTLAYPGVFAGKERAVELNGEAYFEVTANKAKPFIVRTETYAVEALGTAFNVEAYSGKPYFKTALFEGKVKLYKEKEEKKDAIYLHTGETAELKGKKFAISPTNVNAYRWREGLIVIEDKSFEEIMHLFEKYFGQQIIIRNEKVKDLGYSGKLRIADGIEHALRVLQNDFRFTYTREADTNTIHIY